MADKVKFSKPDGFFDTFTRRPGSIKKNMHYCPGCGHGILHKLIAEAMADFKIKDHTVLVAPVGCAVFAYYYFDCYSVQSPHGRAPAIATAISRTNPEDVVMAYQGDGDLASIGFNHILQAANRGENMTVFFVNNAIYGMTGGQMAPTTLIGQVTQTTPWGRAAEETGYPIKVCEMISQFEAPVYVERCALSTVPNIMKARQAVRKAIQNTINKKGFSLVEFLSGCPINLKMKADEMNTFLNEKMSKYFPLGVYKDVAAEREAIHRAEPVFDADKLIETLYPQEFDRAVDDSFHYQSPVFQRECKVKVSGFGGQGVLSLGHVMAIMGKIRNFNVSWLPSYGPEMRGGTANCSVVLSRSHVGSPQADYNCDMLVCLNQPSVEKFLCQLSPKGVLLYDASTVSQPEVGPEQTVYGIAASNIAAALGDQRMANSVMLGAIICMVQECLMNEDEKADLDCAAEEALRESFAAKPKVAEANIKAYYEGKKNVTVKTGRLVK